MRLLKYDAAAVATCTWLEHESGIMAVKLIKSSFEHARRLIQNRQCVLDQRDDWSEHQPSAAKGNDFIEKHGRCPLILDT